MPERHFTQEVAASSAFQDCITGPGAARRREVLSAVRISLPLGVLFTLPLALALVATGEWHEPEGLFLVGAMLAAGRPAHCSYLRVCHL
ncbi:hypothetical protein RM780_05400 [Streptomyces sp. DSM 44917]|uniref:Uncharacterized protein n=1 Tax=Streptomyces boetiae TaxID=3075541 RepID=A0ABU2L4U3_9ACTN|nr:hypothetical protein [Streptomyces sp. DSM 44917]MDT0306397.1 hypothetical protein [Streptomyces sp. DSM 44917]